jgi:hypothetical protein
MKSMGDEKQPRSFLVIFWWAAAECINIFTEAMSKLTVMVLLKFQQLSQILP